MRERCKRCGKTWGVTTDPRENVLCQTCSVVPNLPEGQVRRSPDGLWAVCHGGPPGGLRWRVIGEDPERPAYHGWRYDQQVLGWGVVGNVRDLLAVTR